MDFFNLSGYTEEREQPSKTDPSKFSVDEVESWFKNFFDKNSKYDKAYCEKVLDFITQNNIDGKLLNKLTLMDIGHYFTSKTERFMFFQILKQLKPSDDKSQVQSLHAILDLYADDDEEEDSIENEDISVTYEDDQLFNTLKTYRSNMEKLNEIINQLASICKQFDFWSGDEYLGEQPLSKLQESLNKKIRREPALMFLGTKNSGKSSLINVLLEANLLPVSDKATTFYTIRLKYGETKKVILKTKQEAVEEIPLSTKKIKLSNILVPTERTEEMFATYDEIEIHWPNSLLKSGLCIYDTPGFNEKILDAIGEEKNILYKDLTERSKHVSALIFVTTKDFDPTVDGEFMYELSKNRDKNSVFVILNKIDQIEGRINAKKVRREDVLKEKNKQIEGRKLMIADIINQIYERDTAPLKGFPKQFFALSCKNVGKARENGEEDPEEFQEFYEKLLLFVETHIRNELYNSVTPFTSHFLKLLGSKLLISNSNLKVLAKETSNRSNYYREKISTQLDQKSKDILSLFRAEMVVLIEKCEEELAHAITEIPQFKNQEAVTRKDEIFVAKRMDKLMETTWYSTIKEKIKYYLTELDAYFRSKISSLLLLESTVNEKATFSAIGLDNTKIKQQQLINKITKKHKLENVLFGVTLGLAKLFKQKQFFDSQYMLLSIKELLNINSATKMLEAYLEKYKNTLLNEFDNAVESTNKFKKSLQEKEHNFEQFKETTNEVVLKVYQLLLLEGEKDKHDIQFEEFISRGSFGCVFKGTSSQDSVAIKLLTLNVEERHIASETVSLKVFNDIWKAERVLKPRFYFRYDRNAYPTWVAEYVNTDTFIAIVTEYVNGVSFDTFLSSTHVSNDTIIEASVEIAKGIREFHAHSIAHRDIHPKNIMIYEHPDGQVSIKIIDLGFAKSAALIKDTFCGNIIHMSPEMLSCARAGSNSGSLIKNLESATVTTSTDIYSFGVILNSVSNAINDSTLSKGIQKIAAECCTEDATMRPVIDEVIYKLEVLSSRKLNKYTESITANFIPMSKFSSIIKQAIIVPKEDQDIKKMIERYSKLSAMETQRKSSLELQIVKSKVRKSFESKENFELYSDIGISSQAREILHQIDLLKHIMQTQEDVSVKLYITTLVTKRALFHKLLYSVQPFIVKGFGVNHVGLWIHDKSISYYNDSLVHISESKPKNVLLVVRLKCTKDVKICFDQIKDIVCKYNFEKIYSEISASCQDFVLEIMEKCGFEITNPLVKDKIEELRSKGWSDKQTFVHPTTKEKSTFSNFSEINQYMKTFDSYKEQYPDHWEYLQAIHDAYTIGNSL